MTDRPDPFEPDPFELEPHELGHGTFEDLVAYVRSFGNAGGDPAGHVVQSKCRSCGGTQFWMECSEEDGVAMRTCVQCRLPAHIGDSAELWEQSDVGDATCPCGHKVFELAVGYCLDTGGGVDWMIVGGRCASCGSLGVYADWSIDYEPSRGLLEQS